MGEATSKSWIADQQTLWPDFALLPLRQAIDGQKALENCRDFFINEPYREDRANCWSIHAFGLPAPQPDNLHLNTQPNPWPDSVFRPQFLWKIYCCQEPVQIIEIPDSWMRLLLARII